MQGEEGATNLALRTRKAIMVHVYYLLIQSIVLSYYLTEEFEMVWVVVATKGWGHTL